jgi:glycine cleavage system H protein
LLPPRSREDPSDRKYKSSHEWVKVDGDIATVGITNHAQAALGEIVFVDLPEIGRVVAPGENAAALESVKAAADIYAPIAGEIIEINGKLEDSPNLINENPHDDGWMFQLKISDPSELEELLDSTAYAATTEEK